ncbi:MAG: peptidase S13 [Gammaproteobacteria bacterium]|nr:peptidase S13 [Gammaproteobacteria bacterium]
MHRLTATQWLLISLVVFTLGCSTSSARAPAQPSPNTLLAGHDFGAQDAILVQDAEGHTLYQWQPQKPLIPASLTKLLTTHFAIQKWGLQHRFVTDFYRLNDQLWVRGYGDPFLVSEELDLVVEGLRSVGLAQNPINSIHIDDSYFADVPVPGRSGVRDPYNAPLSAVAANFNTVNLRRSNGLLESAEPQTPLTPTARRLGRQIALKAERINLATRDNAQQYFAELLARKLATPSASLHINAHLPAAAKLVYRHQNSRTLADNLKGALKYSNNFIANQLFLLLAESGTASSPDNKGSQLDFNLAARYVNARLANDDLYQSASIEEGAGLSRGNRLTAQQVGALLSHLTPHKQLLSKTLTGVPGATVHAKTGTLDGVRSYAGFIDVPNNSFRFVFIFNRTVPYGYRDALLRQLTRDLADRALVGSDQD